MYSDVQASLPLCVHQEVVISISKRSWLCEYMSITLRHVGHAWLWVVDGEGASLKEQGPHTPPEHSLSFQHAAIGDVDLQKPGVWGYVESVGGMWVRTFLC